MKETPPLLNAPLIEAIFELRWELEQGKPQGHFTPMRDPSYPMMYGRLYERFKKDFPVIEDLPTNNAHPETTPYIPRHRLRKVKDGHPLIQVGPGIITVNEVKGYGWKNFSSLILKVVEAITELFPEGALPLNFIKAELRYINGIPFDLAKENPLTFLAEKMHTNLKLPEALFDSLPMNERPNGIGCNFSYVLEKPTGHLSFALNMGQVENRPAFIQQTLIQSFGELVPNEKDALKTWLNEAHTVAENAFQVFCKGELMNQFCGA